MGGVLASQELVENVEIPVSSLVCSNARSLQQIRPHAASSQEAPAVKVQQRKPTNSAAVMVSSGGGVAEGLKDRIT